MRATLLATVSVFAFGHVAWASDLAQPVRKAAPAPVVANWTGFYVGAHAGWGWTSGASGEASSAVQDAIGSTTVFRPQGFDLNSNGPLFGGQIGYNWQITPAWVIGLEGDFTGTALKASGSATPVDLSVAPGLAVPRPGALQHMERDINWLASVRGRLGYTWGPGLIYATGGAAWASVDHRANTADGMHGCSGGGGGGVGCSYPASLSETARGWVLGAGYETMIAANWTLRAEYLYYAFGGGKTTTVNGAPAAACGSAFCTATYVFPDFDIHALRFGLNYQFSNGAGAAVAHREAAPAASWTGLYVGLHAGWGWTSNNPGVADAVAAGVTAAGDFARTLDLGTDGPLFGGQIGYNWQLNPSWVVGIEGDFSGTGLKRSVSAVPVCSAAVCIGGAVPLAGGTELMERDVNWLASLRGRLGYTWGPGMIYVTGGAAWANVEYRGTTTDNTFVCAGDGCAYVASVSKTVSGWTLGGGYETMLTANWALRTEYLFYRFDGATISAAGSPSASCSAAACTATYAFPNFDIHAVRLALNYRF